MNIRKSTEKDYENILNIYAEARAFMAEHGNPNQWGTTRPSEKQVWTDIKNKNSYVCEEDGKIHTVFFYREGEDPTYAEIYEGAWPKSGSSKPSGILTSCDLIHSPYTYGVVHRIASTGKRKGSASYCLNWALEQCGCLRIDTHHDNKVMQNLLKKNGFQYCGMIHLEDGSPRLAYQKSL